MTEEIPNNSVLEVKLDYIQKDITAIKADVREIKSDFISRREFDTQIKEAEARSIALIKSIDEKVLFLNKVLYSSIAASSLLIVTAFFKLIIK